MSDLDQIVDKVARDNGLPQSLALQVLADAFRNLMIADADVTAEQLRKDLIHEVGLKGITFAKDLVEP